MLCFQKNQSIENANQSIEMALTLKSTNFSYFKSFPKVLSVKQPIETKINRFFFTYFKKHFFFKEHD